MRSTVNDIARVTGLSPGTVSRALDTTGKYYVSEKARSAVEQAARELRYRPNMAGRSLVAGASKLVSLVSQAPFSNYYTHIAKKLSSFAAADGYCLINDCAFDSEGSAAHATGRENMPRQDWLYGVDGMILCDVAPWQDEYVQSAIHMHIPVVSLGVHRERDIDCVYVDLYNGALALMRHLVEQGYRSIVLLSDESSSQESRGQAYAAVMAEHGLPERVHVVNHQQRSDGRTGAVEEVLQNGAPDAFFCINDSVAIGCCRGLADLGLRVPQDVAVAGCDGIEDGEYLPYPLTTISQPYDEMCRIAWGFLRSRMDDEPSSSRLVSCEPWLTVRESTVRTTS